MKTQQTDIMVFLKNNLENVVHYTVRRSSIKVIYYENDICHVETIEFLQDVINDVEYNQNFRNFINSPKFKNSVNLNLKNILASIGLDKLADKSPSIQKQYCRQIFRDKESITEQRSRIQNTAVWYRYHYDSNVILGIDPIIIETETDNDEYFDFIRVHVHCISPLSHGKRLQRHLIEKDLPVINKLVLDKIKNSKKYNSYGVPVNFLKCTSRVLRQDSILEYVFELKNILDSSTS